MPVFIDTIKKEIAMPAAGIEMKATGWGGNRTIQDDELYQLHEGLPNHDVSFDMA